MANGDEKMIKADVAMVRVLNFITAVLVVVGLSPWCRYDFSQEIKEKIKTCNCFKYKKS